ncbi:molybdopterin-guanine dinucleotide biosynthesis protein B [Zhengella sp. ZM62]|uniref:molybdopterin-guanine dinucleotide biosynthesis protein B n=1 Tax=Zhengella sedimenti TaxID=3390035 RepID=UPI0039764927
MAPPVFGIAGWKNSGKTTLTERLIAGFAQRGLALCSVKHSHHPVMADDPATDSARHARAGAMATALVWPGGWLLDGRVMDKVEPELATVLARLPACDLVLVEGFKTAPHDKIEVRRAGQADLRALEGRVPGIVAIAADHGVASALPCFALDDTDSIMAFIAHRTALRLPLGKAGSGRSS